MKRYFLLTSVLALAACGGGSGGGAGGIVTSASNSGYSTPAAIRSANSSVTQMETFSSSADAMVAAVSSAGIDLSYARSANSRLANHRSASATTLENSFASTATMQQTRAMAELKNMYLIATDDDCFDEATDQELKNAFVLAGNAANAFDASNRTAARAAITTGYEAVLDRFVEKDSGGDYLWRPIISTLEDVRFMMAGENSYLNFELNESGKITSVTKYDYDDFSSDYIISEEGTFVRGSNSNVFTKNLYKYSFDLDSDGVIDIVAEHFDIPLTFMNDNGDKTPADIKSGLLAKLQDRINKIKNSQANHDNDDAIDAALTEYTKQINDAYAAYDENDVSTVFWGKTTVPVTLTIEGVNKGLRYADLGFAKLQQIEQNDDGSYSTGTTYAPYVGGYDARKVDKSSLTASGTVFTGTVIAGIDHSKEKFAGVADVQEGMLVRQDNAKLTMKSDGSSSLVMDNLVATDADHKGKQWYNVTVDTTSAGVPTFTIDDNGKTDIATNFALHTLAEYTDPVTNESYNRLEVDFGDAGSVYSDSEGRYEIHGEFVADVATNYAGSMEATAYGPSTNNPTEASARFGFSEEQHAPGNQNQEEVAIYGAFGGKK